MDSFFNYVKYTSGLSKRAKQIGLMDMINEYIIYYKKFSSLPYKMGFQPDLSYKLFVMYNYIKITYYLWDESTDFVLNLVPRRIQKFLLPKINPLNKKNIVVDKIEFYRIAIKHSLPIPETYFYTQNGSAFSLEGNIIPLNNLEHLEDNIIFSKIINGSAAVGTKKEVFKLDSINLYNYRLYQDALTTHRDILKLSPTKALNCIKISSYLKNNGDVNIQLAFIKLGGENNIVDNIGGKAGGGTAIAIDLKTGCLKDTGYKEVGKVLRIYKIQSTDKRFEGFKVPYFEESVSLVKKAHKEAFYELKHIGWDVGITDNGPVLIEGNSGADMFAAQMICRPFNYYNDDLIQENIINE